MTLTKRHNLSWLAGRRARLLTTAAVAALASGNAAIAQVEEEAETRRPDRAQSLQLEEIVVTGRAGGDAIRKLDAAYAINTLSNAEINKVAPLSTADVFKTVPGVWVESSGGEAGANIMVRGFPGGGDAPFVTVSIEGMPIFPASTLSFLENSSIFRIDETVERLESIRGGVNAVFNKGEIGGTFNFLLKEGGQETEGLIKASLTSFGEKRVDAVFSGPINESTTYMVGGFYRTSDGIRSAQFNSERGGQLTAKITHEMDRGKFSIFARHLDDNVAWLLPIPVLSDAEGNVEDFPGFDRGKGNLIGNDTRLARFEVSPGEFVDRDLGPGRGAQTTTIGGTFFYDLGSGWTISEKFNYLDGNADTFGLVPASVPQTLGSFIDGLGNGAALGSANFISSGAAITDLNQQVLTAGWWSVEKDIESFTNDLSFTKDISDHSITIGAFFADYTVNDLWYLGNNQLLAAEPNARRIDLVLADGREVTDRGFVGGPFFNVNAAYDNSTLAGYVADEWFVNDRLRIDVGLRLEHQEVNGTLENNDFGVDLDGDPNTLFNNSNAVLNGTFRQLIDPATGRNFETTEFSGTIGGNYALTDQMAVFARFSRGHKIPQFDSMRDGNFVVQDSNQYELGFKANTDYVSVFSTLFFNDFKGLPFGELINNVPTVTIGTSSALGVELELVVTPPIEGLSVRWQGTWQNAEFDNIRDGAGNDLSGNRLERQPKVQTRITPTYEADLGEFGYLTLFGTFTYVGKRFSDGLNEQPLPSYTKLDAGAVLDVGDNFYFQVTGDNIGDSNGLTEGNPRLRGAQGTGPILARPILGRSFRFSAGYRF